MNSKNILVLGSGPQNKINGFEFHKIYASNASIIKSKNYINNNNINNINLVATLNSILSDVPTRENINLVKPNRIIVRRGSTIIFPGINFKYTSKSYNKIEQWNFQKQFFNFGFCSLIISELFYGNTLLEKINYLKNCLIYRKGFLGISTGFFTILLALYENPEDKIFISGISMNNSEHFYKLIGKEDKVMTRHKVDNFMIKFLKKKYKKRMFSNNKLFSEIAQIKLI